VNKKMLYVLIIWIISSCKNGEATKAVFDNENLEMIEKTEEIIDEFGLKNYSIRTFYHKSIGNLPSTRNIKSIRAVGDGLLPVLESISDYDSITWDGYIKTFSNDFNGYFEQKTIISNYDLHDGGNTSILYDYISLLIIFDHISDNQRNELLKILNMYVGNANRGDVIYITSKSLLGD
jgi:hypothetical protein